VSQSNKVHFRFWRIQGHHWSWRPQNPRKKEFSRPIVHPGGSKHHARHPLSPKPHRGLS